ncbi:TRAP transporter substrate-binding protein [Alteromonas oceanisediminis]|uniref:TRAP transporter substrate-binding protein n=1 Tax=Alteromonas oceanisediminis TaxID=2836180 RepID=UPI001BDA018F|nr:TRAP transporter substrate-binding protein [Alteromonas oceanisediminis]MBT0585912.1 TRAP transporter substrate-binding protein [Alteromonas oceanisediminis]
MQKIICFLFVTLLLLVGCSAEQPTQTGAQIDTPPQKTYRWKLVTAWPKNFPGLGRGPETFARYVNEMSAGRLEVRVYGAGELVPGFEVFDAVSQGTAQMGHAGAYYWKGKIPAAPIFSAIPFGMNVTEMNAWLHYGGGLELWREIYEPFGVIPFAGGNSGVQMAGWFKNEINSLEDFKGLNMRIPGLGGEVFKKVGGVPVTLTGGEIFTSLQTGAIDATEWVGPYNDLAFGLHNAANNYYHSGWHEPGTVLEFIVNKAAYEALSKDLQAIVDVATRAVNQDMHDEYTARNNNAMQQLINEHGVNVKPLPEDVLAALKQATEEVMAEKSAQDADFARIYAAYQRFYQGVKRYHKLSEQAYYENRE